MGIGLFLLANAVLVLYRKDYEDEYEEEAEDDPDEENVDKNDIKEVSCEDENTKTEV